MRLVSDNATEAAERPIEMCTLPDELAFEVTAELLGVDTPEAARAVFHTARERLVEMA
ncbi:MAG: hypothetical protein H6672_07040 [Anaerolineaceae bacterium]|nr:hypothetical protein [Anaerolineaceae bacterium]